MSCDEDLATGACDVLITERLRYFTGRHMAARDFDDEQGYHRTHRFLHNKMLHGWGIVCGLQVRPHPKPECRSQRVVVRCGMAIDCCGRELVVRRDLATDVIPWSDRPQVDAKGEQVPDRRFVLLLCLEYCETPTEKVPVLYDESACNGASMEYGRIREGVRLAWHWVDRDALGGYGWHTDEDCAPDHAKEPSPCDDSPGGDTRCCLDGDCPEHHCVALAVLTDPPDESDAPSIDVTGRRLLSERRAQLTQLCWINWPHGGIVSPSWLRKQKRLEARFSRELEAVEQPKGSCGPRGINPCTFIVEYAEVYEDIDFVPYARPPYLSADRRAAVFELEDPRRNPGGPFRFLIGHTVYITIKCDFLLDCNRQAVDGNHIGGKLPTGNGTPGGTFESWFTVVSDEDYDRIQKGEPPRQDPDNKATEEES
jgi:hypothetical protein